MHASRAYIAGVGTTSVLIASALLLLGVVSALVAFNGWPGVGIAESTGRLVVDKPKRPAGEAPVQVALNAAPAAAAVAQSPTLGTAAAAATGLTVTGTPDVQVASAVLVPSVDPGAGATLREDDEPQPPPPGSALDQAPDGDLGGGLLPATPLSPPVNRLTDALGNTTQGLTDGLGGTVGRLSPQLGQTVTDTGQVLADLLRSLGQPRR